MNPDECVDNLETELGELRKTVANQTQALDMIQRQLTILVNQTVNTQPTPAAPLTQTPAPPPTTRNGLKPAAPNEFDGSRSKGRAFLNSCELYMNLAPQQFADEVSKVHWALSYMKSGRASLYADRILRFEAKNGTPRYQTWITFREDFVKTFCPKSEAQRALTRLETAEYHQGRRTVDEYIDEFRDLIELAGYTEGLAIVVKFRRGLSREIQDQVATMPTGRPADNQPEAWYEAAALCDENRITNAAFFAAKPTPTRHTTSMFRPPPTFPTPAVRTTPAPPLPTPHLPAPVPMDVDAARRRANTPPTCYRCGQTGHLRRDCSLRHDTRYMTLEEKEDVIQQLLADVDAGNAGRAEETAESAADNTEGSTEEGFVPCSR